jgi:hypothetical protein
MLVRKVAIAASIAPRRFCLLGHVVALLLQLLLLGDVFVRRYPTAVRHRRIDRVNGAAVAGAHDPLRDVAGGDAVHDFPAVLLGIAGEQPGLPTMLDQFAQRAARLHHVRRQFVHAQIRPVADDNAPGRIEHA